MIGPTGAVRVMVATKPVDFRKGAEGLAALVRDAMMADPFSGARPIAHLEGFKGILQVRPADRGHRRPGATCLFPLLNSKTKRQSSSKRRPAEASQLREASLLKC